MFRDKLIILITAALAVGLTASCGRSGPADEARPVAAKADTEAVTGEEAGKAGEARPVPEMAAEEALTEESGTAGSDEPEIQGEDEDKALTESSGTDADSQFTIFDPGLELTVTEGTEKYEGFQVENIMHFSDELPDLIYHSYIPDSYDGSKPYALYIVLPGHGGYYSDIEDRAENINDEHFAVNAREYNDEMIIIAPQPKDYEDELGSLGEMTEIHKPQMIRLTEYMLSNYNIDRNKVFISGYSRGGEMMSLMVAERPELYTAALHISSIWRGDISVVVKEHFPVYFVIGESDEAYGSKPVAGTYEEIASAYRREGISDDDIREIAVLDVKDKDYFTSQGYDNQHLGADLFAYDSNVMGWLFSR